MAIDINEQYIEDTLGEDLSVTLVKATLEGAEKSALVAVVKYQDLQANLGAKMQGVQG